MPPVKHAKLSPSSAHRWMNCPGSVALCEKAPTPPVSPYAEEGTRAHKCLEFILRRYLSSRRAAGEAERSWPSEMINHALTSVDIIKRLKPSDDAKLGVECQVDLSHLSEGMFGTVDAAWAEEFGDLIAIDYKYGAGVEVTPYDPDTQEPNPQLMLYAAGLAKRYDYNFEGVRLAIIQPRIWNAENGGFSEIRFPIDALFEFEAKIKESAARTKDPKAPLCAGAWCKFCPATSICPEISTKALDAAGVVFDVERGLQATPDPKALTPANLSRILPALQKIEVWAAEVWAQAFALASRGEKIEGFKLVAKRASRVWSAGAEEAALKEFGEGIYSKSFLSPAQLEKSFGKGAKPFTEKYTSSVSSGLSLVTAADSRPEANPSAVFDTPEEKPTKPTKKEKQS